MNFIDPDGLKVRLLGTVANRTALLMALQSFVRGKLSIGDSGDVSREPCDQDEGYESLFDKLIASDNLYTIGFGEALSSGGGYFDPRGFDVGGSITVAPDIGGTYTGWKGMFSTDLYTKTTASVLAHEIGHAIAHMKREKYTDRGDLALGDREETK